MYRNIEADDSGASAGTGPTFISSHCNLTSTSQLDAAVVPREEEQKKHIFFQFLHSSEFATRLRGTFDGVGRLVAFIVGITLAGHFTLNEVLQSVENKALADNVQSLRPVGAAYNDNHALNKKRTVCLAGTRTTLLEEIGH
ncbi:hypothetical protein PLEOSDRAFT_153891 [Pleurotus ostreatus PC15]|uniref:Uncharacterized protein n=1 Tax=Pleurotus ostreatus (strain PC15) TaxID=1137138 RepID=A0A067P6Z2_PLEO1|nr:hypothetical protein PLEOSDRAFT_153891 [Pleurotus ostreatus PC15]